MQTNLVGESTRLNLLTRDGALTVEFIPALDQEHYAELFQLAREFDCETTTKSLVSAAAKRWDREVDF